MRSLSLLVALLVSTSTLAFKRDSFKTCDQSGFCRRGRALSARALAADESWQSPYYIDPSSILRDDTDAFFSAIVKSTIYPDVKFSLEVRAHEDGVIRVQMDEVDGLRKHYNEAASWALVRDPPLSKLGHVRWLVGKDDTRARYGWKGASFEVVVQYNPLKVTFYTNGEEQVVLNGRGLLHMEHFRTKQDSPQNEGAEAEQVPLSVNNAAWFEGEQQDAWWEETWSTWTDSKPKGNELRHTYYHELISSLSQARNLSHSTSPSLTTLMCTASLNTLRTCPFLPPPVPMQPIQTLTDSTTRTCSSTLQIPQWLSMALFP